MRRPSGADLDVDPGSEGDDEDVLEESHDLYSQRVSQESARPSNAPRRMARTEGDVAPIVPPALRNGSILTKLSKNKKKDLNFVLDVEAGKVFWNPFNPSKRFYIDDIQQIRLQGDARNYREEFQVPDDKESKWFTIIYADHDRAKGRPVKTMHLIAPDQDSFELWTQTLNDLSWYRHNLMKGLAGSGQDGKTLQRQWMSEMAKLSIDTTRAVEPDHLDLRGVESLCRSLHINCSSNLIRAQFDKADTKQSGYLDFDEFKDFVKRLKERGDLKDIYKKLITTGQDGIDLVGFLNFLQYYQGVDVSSNPAHWQKVFTKLIRKTNPKPLDIPAIADESLLYMSFESFCAFLFSTHNSVVPTKPPELKLERPLNEYFISTSHNTYLLGRQVAGFSSTEAYIRALQKGCRCVEIDCWDGSDGRPLVLHGRTLTKSVPFENCISVISKYAFVASPYPLTLSLEVHCNARQQQIMVDIMVKELGDRLVHESFMKNSSHLPSPEDLRYKILIKAKTEGDSQESDVTPDTPVSRRQRSVSSPWARPQILDNTYIPNMPLLSSPPSFASPESPSPTWVSGRGTMSISSATDDSDTIPDGTFKPQRTKKKKQGNNIESLKELAVYTRGLKFQNDAKLSETKSYNHIFSLAEDKFVYHYGNQELAAHVDRHNMRYLMRVYPKSLRMLSDNFDPITFWRRGVQMAALNWQTYDTGMQINDAMFAGGSDRTGYVLKPKSLRPPEDLSELTVNTLSLGQSRIQHIRFSIDVISAQQLPLPHGSTFNESLDPYVEVEIFSAEDPGKGFAIGEGGQDVQVRNGTSGTGAAHRRRSDIVQNNGYNPAFHSQFKFSLKTQFPDLVFIRWTVWDSPDGHSYNNSNNSTMKPLAAFTAKLSSLQEGYRHLPLHNHLGDQFLFSTLFCRIIKEDPVSIDREESIAEKVGRFKQLTQHVLKRTMSVGRRTSAHEARKVAMNSADE